VENLRNFIRHGFEGGRAEPETRSYQKTGSLRIVEQTTLVGIACLLFNRGRSSIMLSEIRRTPVDDGMTMGKGIFYVW